MKKFTCVYLPIGVPTFHLESAQIQFEKSIKMLSEMTEDFIFPDKMLLGIEDLQGFLKDINPDVIVLQNITFANAAYCSEVLKKLDCPVVLWTLREPIIDGNRLRLNSLTGAYSAGNTLYEMNRTFEYVYGGPDEEEVISEIKAAVNAARVKHSLKTLNVAAVGHTPQGFGFGRALDIDILKYFGANLVSIEIRELINKAKQFTAEECAPYLEEAKKAMVGLEKTSAKNVEDFVKLYKAYKDYVIQNNIGALATRCWPDFFVDYGTPVCGVLGLLNDNNISASCESDVYGAISMYIGSQLSGCATFFGDPVSLDESENTITFWHCGTAACSIAREDTGAEIGVHPNRKIGPTMEYGCKPSDKATVFRIGRKKDGTFRFFIAGGEILDKPKQFCGTSMVVKTKSKAKEIVSKSVKNGFEPHFIVIYGDVEKELEKLANMMDMEICKY
ncbi:MAG: fucose isomerase [Clostridia bacterium]|nr:fucose isomerase [Clostridia bacterium]